MGATVRTVNGDTYNLHDDISRDVRSYFTMKDGMSTGLPLGWVSYFENGKKVSINFNHVVRIEFD